MNTEVENAKRSNEFNERQMKLLKEQFKNMQVVYSSQEKDLQKKQRVVQEGDSIRIELKNATDKLTRMRREHLLEMDEQKEKYQTLLHEHTDLERQLTAI